MIGGSWVKVPSEQEQEQLLGQSTVSNRLNKNKNKTDQEQEQEQDRAVDGSYFHLKKNKNPSRGADHSYIKNKSPSSPSAKTIGLGSKNRLTKNKSKQGTFWQDRGITIKRRLWKKGFGEILQRLNKSKQVNQVPVLEV